jgi:uncharacterized protein (TIGR03067 family)
MRLLPIAAPVFAVSLAVPLVDAAPVPKELRKARPELEGAWRLTGQQMDDLTFAPEKAVWRFDGGTLVTQAPGRPDRVKHVRCDPTSTPKAIDVGALLGTYEIDGDTLVICVDQQGRRPTHTRNAPDVLRITLKRVTDEK